MADSGLMASLSGWLMDDAHLDPDHSGKLMEKFAFNEIMAHIDAADGRYELFHYRDREKREIDFLIEREDSAFLGIEIKAGSAVGKNDFKHLRRFQNNLAKNVASLEFFFTPEKYQSLLAMIYGPYLLGFYGLDTPVEALS